jgi:hypothetical protein
MLLSTVAYAGSSPKELYGKSITVAWSESITGKFTNDQAVRNIGRAEQMNIYVSTAGRPFVRLTGTGIGGLSYHSQMSRTRSQSSESGPEQSDAKDRVDFQGRTIVAYREFESGARRISIDVEGADAACKAAVLIARQAGSNVVTREALEAATKRLQHKSAP